MKLLHLSDLHLGKRVNEFSMLEDQEYILGEILRIADAERPDGVMVAGDLYDKPLPSAEAVQLCDRFLEALAARRLQVFILSGNHDSPERLAFAAGLIRQSGVYLSPVYDGQIRPIELTDAYGRLCIWLIPFLKPAQVRGYVQEEIATYTDALEAVIRRLDLDLACRNVAVAHQFVAGAVPCESEERSVGGVDSVDPRVFAPFDYVALGHLHTPQRVGKPTVRYSGSPLKYSFSEIGRDKSVTVVELNEKGAVELRAVPLTPKRDLRALRGRYDDLTLRKTYEALNREDYYRITLTDEEDLPDAISRLRVIYPHLMRLEYDNQRTRESGALPDAPDPRTRSPLALLDELYAAQNNRPMNPAQREFASALIQAIWEDAQ